VVSGSFNSTITFTGGSPHIYLDNATVSVGSGNGVNITGGNPTIHVVGGNNSVTSNNGAGIYVAENSTVTITGDGRDDVLTVNGNDGSAGIGWCYNETLDTYMNCGNILIQNITLSATGSNGFSRVAPAIGSVGTATCGNITIDNAAVSVLGGTSPDRYAPGIGCGFPNIGYPTSIPVVTIKNQSVVNARRGGYNADYIGWSNSLGGGVRDSANPCNLGTGGSATNSTIIATPETVNPQTRR